MWVRKRKTRVLSGIDYAHGGEGDIFLTKSEKQRTVVKTRKSKRIKKNVRGAWLSAL